MCKNEKEISKRSESSSSNPEVKSYFISLKNDYAFCQVIKNPMVLQGFLSAIMKEPIENIQNIDVQDRYLDKNGLEGKQGVLDVRAYVRGKGTFNIELQMYQYKYWANRNLFYMSKIYVEDVERGADYDQCRKVIAVNVLGFNLCRETDYFYSQFHFREDRKNFLYSDMMEIHVVELTKLAGEVDEEDSNLHKWARFIAADSEEARKMIEKDPYIEEALKELELLSQDPERKKEYDAREKALRDYRSFMKAEREEGREEGRTRERCNTIQRMLEMGVSHDMIAAATDVSVEYVKELAAR